MLLEILRRFDFWKTSDRVGPDIPLTHWQLHFKSTMRKLCISKFKKFGVAAEFRPGAYAICCSKISIGDRVVIRPGCMFFADPRDSGAGIYIDNDVMLGSGVHIYVHNHRYDDPSVPIIDQGSYDSEPVFIEQGAWIGAKAIILPGVRVGRNSVVGAGSVVTRDVPAFSVSAGNPARVLRLLKENEN